MSIQKVVFNPQDYVHQRVLERRAFEHEQSAEDVVPLISRTPLDDLHRLS